MKRIAVAVILFSAVLNVSPAQADLLFFSPLGIASEAYTGPTSPVPVDADGFRLTYHGGGSKTLVDPILLILGIPTGFAPPTLTLGAMDDEFNPLTSYIVQGGTNMYGGIWDTGTGYAGTFTAAGNTYSPAPNPKVYAFMRLTEPGVSSQNYTNWSGVSSLDSNSWDLYVWSIYLDPNLQRDDPDWVEIEGNLAGGTFAIAYGCQVSGPTCDSKYVQSTPFTRAAFVPEPSSLALLMSSVGLIFSRRRSIERT